MPILGSVVGFGRATQTAPNSPGRPSSPSMAASPRGRFRSAAERLTRGLTSRGIGKQTTDAEASPQSVLNATFTAPAAPSVGVPQVDAVPPSPLAMNPCAHAGAAGAGSAEAAAPAAPAAPAHGFVRSRGKGASTLSTSKLSTSKLTPSALAPSAFAPSALEPSALAPSALSTLGMNISSCPSTPSPPSASPQFARF